MPGNPLGHTFTLSHNYIKINGELCSEFTINAMLASSLGIPVYAVTGDKELCDRVNAVNPNILTVSTNEGYASCSKSIHPDLAVRLIEETVERAVKQDRESCMYPIPSEFIVEICFKEQSKTASAGFYPGAVQTDFNFIRFETRDFFEVLRFFHFVL
jgi:D-amino peptidase